MERKKADFKTHIQRVNLRSDPQASDLKSIMLENITDSVFLLDKDGKILYLNKTAHQSRGYTKEEMLGRNISFLWPKKAMRETQRWRKRIFQKRKASFDTINKLKNGEQIPVHVSAKIINIAGRELELAVVSNISQRKRSERLLKARFRILEASAKSTSLNEFLILVIDEIQRQTSSEIGFYHFVESDQETLFLQEWSTNTLNFCSAAGKGTHYPISKAGVWAEAIHKRKPVIHNNYQALTNKKGMPKGHVPVFRELVVPIMRGPKIVGVFGVGNKESDYNQDDLEIALLLGDFSWEITERKKAEEEIKTAKIIAEKRFEAEKRIADTLQEALTTLPKKIQGIKYGKIYRSASQAARVGGDFYDLFEIEENLTGIVIGDVAGKGLEAAALTALTRNTIRAYAHDKNSTPATVMKKTDLIIRKSITNSGFITVFFAILNIETGKLMYCGCGHPPAIVWDGGLTLLKSTSTPLGVGNNVQFKNERIPLNNHAKLYLYTDGVVEARREGDFYGEKSLINQAEKLHELSTHEIPQKIFKDVSEFSKGKLNDDLIILCLEFCKKSIS